MGNGTRFVLNLAARHTWKLFLAIGIVYVWFGWTDIDEATRYEDSVAAMSLLVSGVLTIAISVTALRRRERWAWIAMLIWPIYGISFAIWGWGRPGGAAFGIVHIALPGIPLLLSAPGYLVPKSSESRPGAKPAGTGDPSAALE